MKTEKEIQELAKELFTRPNVSDPDSYVAEYNEFHVCAMQKLAFTMGYQMAQLKWIDINDRLPTVKERKENWKFLVKNINDEWVDAAYFDNKVKPSKHKSKWHNGESYVFPSHWGLMPLL